VRVIRKKYFGYRRGYRGRRRLWVARRAIRVVHKYDRMRASYPIRKIVRADDPELAVKHTARLIQQLEKYRERVHKATLKRQELNAKKAQSAASVSSGGGSQFDRAKAAADNYLRGGAIPNGGVYEPSGTPSTMSGSSGMGDHNERRKFSRLNDEIDSEGGQAMDMSNPAFTAANMQHPPSTPVRSPFGTIIPNLGARFHIGAGGYTSSNPRASTAAAPINLSLTASSDTPL